MLRSISNLVSKAAIVCIAIVLLSSAVPGMANAQDSASQLKLAVVVVVDQMRADYLSRWSQRYSHGLHRLLEEGTYFTSAHHDHAATVTGTSHGTPYHYDTDVPIVFYGDSIRPKVVSDSVRSVDIAPTLAALLKVTPEAGVDGKVLPVIGKTQ